MASLIVNRGLQIIGERASGITQTAITSMSIDDSSTAFAAGDTALNSGGAVTNEADADFDATPTRSSQTVSHVATFGTGVFNTNVIRRIALHNAAAASVSSSSTTLIAGVDGQSLTKNSSFSVTITLKITYTSA
jgi:hypothetical protein